MRMIRILFFANPLQEICSPALNFAVLNTNQRVCCVGNEAVTKDCLPATRLVSINCMRFLQQQYPLPPLDRNLLGLSFQLAVGRGRLFAH